MNLQLRNLLFSKGLTGLTAALLLGVGSLGVASAQDEVASAQDEVVIPAGSSLSKAVAGAAAGQTFRLQQGVYPLTPKPYQEDLCGNCPDATTPVTATVGLLVKGNGIRILGPETGEAVIQTGAGYGILFEDCQDCELNGVTVTGGQRDTSQAATDGAVVVKRSKVLLSACVLRGNLGDSVIVARTVVGIAGVVGRELSNLTIRDCRIIQNSWDGIALYRGARAVIEGNLIDGVVMARGTQVGGGRGVGIGLTWNADAEIRGNLIRNYWKGIGVFVNAQATVEENIVEHVATWGMSLWDADQGKPAGYFLRNIVYDTGACGVSLIRSQEGAPFPGRFVNNILVQTGQDPRYDSGEPYCFQEPVARHAVPSDFTIAENVLYDNRTPEDAPAPGDLTAAMFRERVASLVGRFGTWPMLRESDFWKTFVTSP